MKSEIQQESALTERTQLKSNIYFSFLAKYYFLIIQFPIKLGLLIIFSSIGFCQHIRNKVAPSRSGNITQEKENVRARGCEMLCSGHDMTITLRNSQQLWLIGTRPDCD